MGCFADPSPILYPEDVIGLERPTQNGTTEQVNELFIDSEGSTIFCRTIGKGKPLIVIHGGPGSGQDYLLPQFYDLAKNNFVIFYDQRGAGRSTGEINEDSMAISVFVKDLEVLRKAFNFDRVSLLGHSWGGFVAMHYAIEHPGGVLYISLFRELCNTPPTPQTPPPLKAVVFGMPPLNKARQS